MRDDADPVPVLHVAWLLAIEYLLIAISLTEGPLYLRDHHRVEHVLAPEVDLHLQVLPALFLLDLPANLHAPAPWEPAQEGLHVFDCFYSVFRHLELSRLWEELLSQGHQLLFGALVLSIVGVIDNQLIQIIRWRGISEVPVNEKIVLGLIVKNRRRSFDIGFWKWKTPLFLLLLVFLSTHLLRRQNTDFKLIAPLFIHDPSCIMLVAYCNLEEETLVQFFIARRFESAPLNYGLLALFFANRPLLTDFLLRSIPIRLLLLIVFLLLIVLLLLLFLTNMRKGACEEDDLALEIRCTVRLKRTLQGLHVASDTAFNRILRLAFERSTLDVEHRKPYWL